MDKEEILKLIASPLKEVLVDKDLESFKKQEHKRLKVNLEFELKTFKQYYSVTSITNVFVGSMFELDFDKLELLFKKQNITNIDKFRLKVA